MRGVGWERGYELVVREVPGEECFPGEISGVLVNSLLTEVFLLGDMVVLGKL